MTDVKRKRPPLRPTPLHGTSSTSTTKPSTGEAAPRVASGAPLPQLEDPTARAPFVPGGSATPAALWNDGAQAAASWTPEALRALVNALPSFSPEALRACLDSGDLPGMRAQLLPGVVRLLAKNTRSLSTHGTEPTLLYTVPSSEVYEGNLFHWDCASGAEVALAAARDVTDPRLQSALRALATQSLFAMVRFQVTEGPNRGMFSHMGFDGGDSAALWQHPHQSSITQPPLFARAVQQLPNPAARKALEPFVRENLNWWLRERLIDGLPFVVHPWETGCDAGPNHDVALSPRFGPARGAFKTLQTKNPGLKNEAVKMARGNLLLDQQALAEGRGEHPLKLPAAEAAALFESRTPDMAAHLVRALDAGAALAEEAGRPDDAQRFRDAASQMREAARTHLWDADAKFFRTRAPHPGAEALAKAGLNETALGASGLVQTDAGTAFTVLAAGIPTREQALELVKALRSERFNTRHPIPSVATDDPRFVANEYWRGSTWININCFVVEGLHRYALDAARDGEHEAARAFAAAGAELCRKTVELAGVNGFYEFYWSETPAAEGASPGCGPEDLTWSGLSYPALDLLEELERLAK